MTGIPDQPPHVLKWQRVLNWHWPDHPERFRNHRPGIPVTARVVWERDGEEWLEGEATRWDDGHVYVELGHTGGRLQTTGVWLKPDDVYRAAPEDETAPPS